MSDWSQHPPPTSPLSSPPRDQDASFAEAAPPLLASIEAQRRTMENVSILLIAKNQEYASELRELGQCLAKVKTGYATPNEGDQLVPVFAAVREHLREEASSIEKARRLEKQLERIKEDHESIASEVGQCLKIIKPDSVSPGDNKLASVLKEVRNHLTKIKGNESNLTEGIRRLKEEKETACKDLKKASKKLKQAEDKASKANDTICREKREAKEKLHQASVEAGRAKTELSNILDGTKNALSGIEFPPQIPVNEIVGKVWWLADDRTKIRKQLDRVNSSFKRAKAEASNAKSEMESAVSDIEFPHKMELLEKVKWLAHRHKNFQVPRVGVSLADATRGLHHYKLQIGLITEILGNIVNVEAASKSRPLEKGDFLWITETGLPLGALVEVSLPALVPKFVKAIHYVIKYDSAEEVPAGISVGTAVSCILNTEHILDAKDLAKDFTGNQTKIS